MPQYNFNGQDFSLDYPAVMGILNLTPDSFSDGGQFIDPEIALERIHEMVEQGAQIIDLGAESTRPGSNPISEQEELSRLLPLLERLPKNEFILSLDTTKTAVAHAGLQTGVHVINDVSGGKLELLNLAARFRAGFVLMHTQGSPKTMQNNPAYENVTEEVNEFFRNRKKEIEKLNLPRIWVDPGIGFGKTLEHNLELMRGLDRLIDPSWGVLLGSSRKSWIDHLCDAPGPLDRMGGSLASAIAGAAQGVEIIRAHDVHETVQALKVAKVLAQKH